MGRAMLIICAGALVAMGFINISTSRQGISLTEKNVNYADFIMAKNTAQTAIQIAMQHINADEDWPNVHHENNPWTATIEGREVTLYTVYQEHPDYFEADTLRLVSNAQHNTITVQVNSLYWMQPFASLVPEFAGALQLPSGIGDFNVDGNAHGIQGTPPEGHGCGEVKPPVAVADEETKQKLEAEEHLNVDGDIILDESLSYEPTDELIERLFNSGNAITINGDYGSALGTAENPGVFFIEDGVKLTGQQSVGYGIMVIRSGGTMEYEGALSVAGNFEFNGLIIFENAFDFDGRGTPTINGSVLVGNTPEYQACIDAGEPECEYINIDLGGNIDINYDCLGEKYAKMAAADAVKQNKYTRVVTTEGANFMGN